jgi:hypothetical protein
MNNTATNKIVITVGINISYLLNSQLQAIPINTITMFAKLMDLPSFCFLKKYSIKTSVNTGTNTIVIVIRNLSRISSKRLTGKNTEINNVIVPTVIMGIRKLVLFIHCIDETAAE